MDGTCDHFSFEIWVESDGTGGNPSFGSAGETLSFLNFAVESVVKRSYCSEGTGSYIVF